MTMGDLCKQIKEKEPHLAPVLAHLEKIDRRNFLPALYQNKAYEDIPLPIGEFQTTSQPSVIALMASKMNFQPGDLVLEIGLGCGYTTALTHSLIIPEGKVTSIERIRKICILGQHNLKKYSSEAIANKEISIFHDNGLHASNKFPPESFNNIYVTAGIDKASHFPINEFIKLLKPEGLLLFPESNGSLFLYSKSLKGNPFLVEEIPGFTFVPIKTGKA
jgi:protein-L-isoaspartate(D-aspartate) O-methyltransferase